MFLIWSIVEKLFFLFNLNLRTVFEICNSKDLGVRENRFAEFVIKWILRSIFSNASSKYFCLLLYLVTTSKNPSLPKNINKEIGKMRNSHGRFPCSPLRVFLFFGFARFRYVYFYFAHFKQHCYLKKIGSYKNLIYL